MDPRVDLQQGFFDDARRCQTSRRRPNVRWIATATNANPTRTSVDANVANLALHANADARHLGDNDAAVFLFGHFTQGCFAFGFTHLARSPPVGKLVVRFNIDLYRQPLRPLGQAQHLPRCKLGFRDLQKPFSRRFKLRFVAGRQDASGQATISVKGNLEPTRASIRSTIGCPR
jgi:hypothetical protein